MYNQVHLIYSTEMSGGALDVALTVHLPGRIVESNCKQKLKALEETRNVTNNAAQKGLIN